jgi:spermidine/putrescine-binding protein
MAKKHKMTSLVGILIIGMVFCMTLAVATNVEAKRNTLVIQTWGGAAEMAINKAFVEPFIKETGIKAKTVAMGPEVFGKLGAMVKSNNIEFDITTSIPKLDLENLDNKGLYDRIDYSVLKKNKDLYAGAYQPWGVGTAIEWYGLVYNANTFPGNSGPQTLQDFWDVKKFPQPRAFPNWGGYVENLMIALWADGVPVEKSFPLDLDRAFKKMDQIKPHIKVWFNSGAQLVQILRDEEVLIAISSEGRTKQAMKDGTPFKMVYDTGWYFMSYFAIVKNTPMKDAVHKFFEIATRPQNQATFTKLSGYPSTNRKSMDYLDPAIVKSLVTNPDVFPKAINLDAIPGCEYKREKADLVLEKWHAWLAK